jgi:hypothetical protein
MKVGVVLTALVLLLILTITASVYAYGCSALCQRTSFFWWSQNKAVATISATGLQNGSYNVYAYVDSPNSKANSFADGTYVGAQASDTGPYNNPGTASSYVGGYDSNGNYQFCPANHTN